MSHHQSLPRFITAPEIRKTCSNLLQQIDLQKQVFSRFAKGQAIMGPRVVIPGSTNPDEEINFSYIARAKAIGGRTVVKVGSFVPSNAKRENIPVVNAYMNVLGAVTGQLEAMIDGEEVTTMRTAAASLCAAQALLVPVNKEINTLKIVIVGAGVQGCSHARFARALYPEASITFLSRSVDRVAEKEILSWRNVSHSTSIIDVCAESDLIFLCTNSSTSIFPPDFKFKKGSTIISVGSFAPNRAEVDPKLIEEQIDVVLVDDKQTCLEQCGSIRGMNKDSLLNNNNEKKFFSLGEYLNLGDDKDSLSKKRKADEVAIHFSVGLGIQDAVVADFLLDGKM